MDRRTFIGSCAALAVPATAISASSKSTPRFCTVITDEWTEISPTGVVLTFTKQVTGHKKKVVCSMVLRGEEYALGFIDDDPEAYERRMRSLQFAIQNTIYNWDERDGLLKHPYVSDMDNFSDYTTEHRIYVPTNLF